METCCFPTFLSKHEKTDVPGTPVSYYDLISHLAAHTVLHPVFHWPQAGMLLEYLGEVGEVAVPDGQCDLADRYIGTGQQFLRQGDPLLQNILGDGIAGFLLEQTG